MKPTGLLLISQKIAHAYNQLCLPVLEKYDMPKVSFDILMFLANNPQYQTARDIVSVRRLKANLVSFHVEKLVQEGFLVRQNVQGDRRKIALVCTEKAQPVIESGRKVQKLFHERMTQGIREEMLEVMRQMVEITKGNVERILTDGNF